MDQSYIKEIIRKRLNLEDHDWSIIEKNSKFQKLFQHQRMFRCRAFLRRVGTCGS